MSVIRVHKTKNFTVMSNTHLFDKNLSLKAAGLLSKILALPDNWNYSIKGLCAICKENETAVKNALNELRDNRYVIVERIEPSKETKGRIQYEYFVYEQPQGEDNKKVDIKEAYKAKQEQEKQSKELQGVENLGVEKLAVESQGGILNTKIPSTDKTNMDLSNTKEPSTKVNYTSKDVKRPSFEENMYTSVPEEQEGHTKKPNRYIPPDYTEEQLREHIRPTIEENYERIEQEYDVIHKPDGMKLIEDITVEFFRQYEEKYGVKHRILPDKSYISVLERFISSRDDILDGFEMEEYEMMIKHYFKTNFDKRGNYGKKITRSLSHFMSYKILMYLTNREGILWEKYEDEE